MKTHLFAASFLACAFSLPAFAGSSSLSVKTEGPVVISGAISLIVHSAIVGRDFVIEVTAPRTPPILPGQTAPVIYVLDGGYDLAGPAGWLLGAAGTMAPAYIVTVGYPAGVSARGVDLLSGPATSPDGIAQKGGGADAFRRFLVEELKPLIEARYPVDSTRSILFGHSLSGLFTANVLANHPEDFAGYLIASPSVWADPGIVDRLRGLQIGVPPRRVFVSYGANEEPYMISGARQVGQALSGVQGVLVQAKAFEGEQHISYYPALPNAAFPFLLPRDNIMRRPNPIELPVGWLKRYLGVYELADHRRVAITEDDDGLVFKIDGRDEAGLLAEAVDRFFIRGVDANVVFDAGDGPAKEIVISLNGATARALRVR